MSAPETATFDTCFNSALRDLEFLMKQDVPTYYHYKEEKCVMLSNELRYLRTFHLYSSKWGNDDADAACLGALLLRIEDAVSKIAQDIHPFCISGWEGKFPKGFWILLNDVTSYLFSFEKEINQWYIKFSDCSDQSCSLDSDDLVEFIHSILGRLNFLSSAQSYNIGALIYQLEALEEKLIFLKNFTRFFTTLGGGEGSTDGDRHLGQNLLTHIKAVTVTAAHYSYMCHFRKYDGISDIDDLENSDDGTSDGGEGDDEDDGDDRDDIDGEDGRDDEDDGDDRDDIDGEDDRDDEEDIADGVDGQGDDRDNTDDEEDNADDIDDRDGIDGEDDRDDEEDIADGIDGQGDDRDNTDDEEDNADDIDDEVDKAEMQFKISGLLQRIKPVDPQVYETYVQPLIVKKLTRQSNTATMEKDEEHILEDFSNSLLSNLWEILKAGTFPMFSTSTKDQLQILYGGLRSLRTILKKQPTNFDEKMWDLIRVVVCDGGIVIFTLFLEAVQDGLAKEMDLLLSDLLERIKFIGVKVAEESPQGSTFNFPTVDELGFVDFLLENLMELMSSPAVGPPVVKHQIQTIQEELVLLRHHFLEKLVELRHEKEEIQTLWNCIVELAHKMEFFIDSSAIEVVPDSSQISFDSIMEEIKIIKLDVLKIFDSKEGHDIKVKKVTKTTDHLSSGKSMPTSKVEIVGLDDEVRSIKERLKTGADQLQMVAIVGMPGLGKTTLAKLVYNDPSITHHFHIRVWCCISQVYNKKSLLLETLASINNELPDKCAKKSEEDLALELYQSLKRKRYLFVLDDVWEIDAWNCLKESFPDDKNRSRIILTTRDVDVAQKDNLDPKPHFLRPLTYDESWKLLKVRLFSRIYWPPKLQELGMQIVERSKGLPLIIVIVAGILATTEQDDWKGVVEHLSSSSLPLLEQCKDMLEISYRYLPEKLKPCLLYFGAFPEDRELNTNKLTWLWIAEGFVRKTQSKSLEDEAKDCLMHLINKSLVMVDKQSSTGRVKSCRIHDLLHEFCVKKAKEEKFFQLLKGYNEVNDFNEPHKVRRLCILSKTEHFKESRLYCPQVRSLFFFPSDNWCRDFGSNPLIYISTSKLVKVLELSEIYVNDNILREIELLVQLRYLAINGLFSLIPSSIANLSNLETLIVETCLDIYLPDNIWNLKKLRHLQTADTYDVGFDVPRANLDNSEELRNLEVFSTANIYCKDLKKILRKFPNIRKLKCKLFKPSYSARNKVLVPDDLSRLESLNISAGWDWISQYQFGFYFPLNLRKLTLSEFGLPWCKISAIGNLPNLEVLKLLKDSFIGKIWNMEEAGQFPKLIFLKLSNLMIVRWTDSIAPGNPFPRLVKLVLKSCDYLEEFPRSLGDLPALQRIEVSYCSKCAVSLINQIKEEQVDMGNDDFEVLIRSYDTEEEDT